MASNDLIKQIANPYARILKGTDLKWSAEKQFFAAVIRQPKVRDATPESIHDAGLQCAAMGLSWNPQRKHVYMIPRKARKRRQGESDTEYNKVPLIAYASPSYMGLMWLADLLSTAKSKLRPGPVGC